MTEQVNDTTLDQQPAPAPSGDTVEQAKPVIQKPEVSFERTGDRAVDGALRILSRAGVSPDSFEMDAARRGEFAPLRAVLGHLNAEDGDIAIQLLEAAYQQYQDTTSREEEELRKGLLEIAGGAKEWDAVLEFIDTNADPDEAEELMAALDEGGAAARMAARYMTLLHQSFGQGSQEEQETTPESPRASPVAGKSGNSDYISADEFYKQYQTLLNQGVSENDSRIVRLQQARLRSIKVDGY